MGSARWTDLKLFVGILFALCVAGAAHAGTVKSTVQSANPEIFVCTQEGRFRNPTDANKYITCTMDVAGGGYMRELGSCPSKAFYNQKLDACVISLRTTTSAPTTTTNSSPESAASVDSSPSFTCTNLGRFPDTSSCQSYYICYKGADDSFYGPYKYNCPPKKHFNTTAKRCTNAAAAGCTAGSLADRA